MSVLSGPEIARLVKRTRELKAAGKPAILPTIEIDPFDDKRIGPNSYDVLLAPELRVYAIKTVYRAHPELFQFPSEWHGNPQELNIGLDSQGPNPTIGFPIPETGFWLCPGVLYLGATVERTKCEGLVPWLDGRSSAGRLGISLHVTAGRGDDGWPGRWTTEMTVIHPIAVYPNMRLGQLTYFTLEGERKPYEGRYVDQDGPTESRLHTE